MRRSSIKYLNTLKPIKLESIVWEEPILHMKGENFIFNSRTEFRLILPNNRYIGCYDTEIFEYLKILIGQEIIEIEFQNSKNIDPMFKFQNGYEIEIFSTSNKEETWTIRIPEQNVLIESNENER